MKASDFITLPTPSGSRLSFQTMPRCLIRSTVLSETAPEGNSTRRLIEKPRSADWKVGVHPQKTNMEPENEPLEEEIFIKNHHF